MVYVTASTALLSFSEISIRSVCFHVPSANELIINAINTKIIILFQVISACHLTQGQLPQRLNIPGAVLLSQSRPAPFRQQRIQQEHIPQRPRRPAPQNAIPAPIRPVIEETEESVTATSGSFDDEVTKLGISALQNAVRQNGNFEDEAPLKPVQFRPERPIPVLRQNVREGGPVQKPLPVFRQEQKENIPKPLLRQEYRDDISIPVRQQIRQVNNKTLIIFKYLQQKF